mgnify:CR=1 FL=1
MKIEVKRLYRKPNYTIGKLYIDGEYFCDTLEDFDRGLSQSMSLEHLKRMKVPRQTAIPTGVYKVTVNVISPKFSLKPFYKKVCNGKVPRILNVPAFDGILFHYGENQNWTDGCVLIGYNKEKGKLTDGQEVFEKFYERLKCHDDITVEIH